MMAAVSFLASPGGRLVAVLAGVLALYTVGYWRGHARAALSCQTASLKAEIAFLRQDIEEANQATKRFELEAVKNAAVAADNQKIIDSHQREVVNARPVCPSTPVDDRRMLGIR